jgi:alpha-1,3-rhamnosyl/mannosyltransferase
MPYRPGVLTVVTIYDLIPLLFPTTVSFQARLLFRWTTQLALGAAQDIIVISEASRLDLLHRFSLRAGQVTAVPLAADPRFRPCPPEEVQQVRERYGLPPAYVLYLGINKPHKNLVRLVEAWSQVAADPWQLVIAGAWDERYPESRQRAAELKLGQRVRFLGRIADSDLPALYSGAGLFIFPSRYEGFGLPIVEAMACGAPVACSNSSSLPEVAGDAALLFDPEDTGAMVAAIERVLTDETLREELRQRGLVQARRFSWQRTAAETLAIYRRLGR